MMAEYVVLLALLVSVAAIGLSAVGSRAQQTLGKLTDSGPSGPRRASPASSSAGTSAHSGELAAGEPRGLAAGERDSSVPLWIAFGGILVALSGTLLGRRRKPAALPQDAPAEADGSPTAVSSPFQDKRWWLWHTLVNGSELVLQNRVEVRHLMTRTPKTVSPQITVAAMRELMQQHRLRHLLVCEKGKRLVGVVSDRDLGRSAPTQTAAQIMTAQPRTVAPATPVGTAIALILDDSISCLPVVEEGMLCGLLTTTDLILTLQCLLQLWLRLGQTFQESPEWAKHLEALSAALDRSVATAGTAHS